MKNYIFFFLAFLSLASDAQYYQFSKTTGAYSNLTGATVVLNGNWNDTLVSLKNPFYFRFFSSNILAGLADSVQVDDFGNIYFNNINNGFIEVFRVDLNSRGNNKSPISFKVEGASPSRILKIQYMNVGFDSDAPAFSDSMNFQVWIYETSSILEFRYGPNSVKHSSYAGENGAYVDIADPLGVSSNFIALEGDPSNPTVRTNNFSAQKTLTGTPVNGTIYRFTPSQFHTGIQSGNEVKINIIQNKLSLPAGMEVMRIKIYNVNGQLLQSALNAEEVEFNIFPHGLYILNIETKEGLVSRKLIL